MHTLPKLMAISALLLATSSVSAAEKITIMVGGLDKQIYLPAKLAEQLGYLKETGLDIALLTEPNGVNAESEMLDGAAQGVVGFYDHTIDLQARGKMTQSVVQFSQAPGEVILVSKASADKIKSAADFRGKSLGVTGLGSSTNFLTMYLAYKSGVNNKEFSTVAVGAGNTFINAMAEGKIDAGMTTEPTISRLLSSGAASILIDLRSLEKTAAALGGAYPGACLYMPTAWVNAHQPEVQKIAAAFVKTLRYIRTHSGKEIAEQMPAEYYGANKQMYIDAIDAGKMMFTADGVMPEGGPETVLAVFTGFVKAVQNKKIDLGATYTSAFVQAVK